ncbi:hypothetical protein [Streptomyces sp. NPDC093260]|uniref:hypothetical protein n=1 Tax=Streptomyces sp. NPDC093260 TaxID=3155073 RepID=UPI003426F489
MRIKSKEADVYPVRLAVVGAITAALVAGSGAITTTSAAPETPVTAAAISGKWIYTYKSPSATERVQSYGKVQLCFNVKGDHLYQGYKLSLWQRIGGVGARNKQLWHKNYWGPKHRTCTPWKSAGYDMVWAEIVPVKYPRANAAAQVWLYNP